jgi:hypothetical protein
VSQVLAFGGVMGQVDRAVVGRHGFFVASELVEQVRAGGPGGLEAAGGLAGIAQHGVKRGEAGRGALDLGGDGGKREAGTEKARPTCSAVKPSTVLSMRGVCAARSIAGWAHTSISSSLRSGIASTSMSSA